MRLHHRYPAPSQDRASWAHWSRKKYPWQQVSLAYQDRINLSTELRLFGGYNGSAQCSQYGSPPYKFGVGHRAESHTNATTWMVGHYLGDPANPCITVIDTPGTGDTEGRDCDHAIALAEDLKKMGSIDAFLLLFKGVNLRFDQRMQEQITLFRNIFGANLFQNVITEFTFWSHDKASIRKRKRNQAGLDEEEKHRTWNQEYQEKFDVQIEIPSVFIDPVYDKEVAEESETRINQENTDKLWNLITRDFKTFRCDKRCKAPSGFFSGQPWLFEQNEEVNKRLGDRAVITWQIWFAGCDGTGTKSFTIVHQTPVGGKTTIYEKEVQEEEVEVIHDSRLMEGMQVVDEPSEKFKTIRLTIESTEDAHFGVFSLKNDKGESEESHLKKIVDGEWEGWGPFSACSKTCISGDEEPGTMHRQRGCKPPQNGGQPCKGKNKDTRTCAHRPGDSQDIFRYININGNFVMNFHSPGSAPLMLSGVPGRKIGANATTIVRQREARCHGGQGKESASLQSMEDKIVRFLRARQRKTINFCTKSSKIVVTFQHVPDLLLLVPGASGQLVGVPAILRVQTHLKEAGSEPAKKPHFQLMKD